MKKYFLGGFLLLSLFLVTGCGKSIVGKWRAVGANSEYHYLFNKDKTCSYEMLTARLDCTYEVNNGILIILFKGNEKPNKYEYRFEEDVLIIKDSSGKDNKFVKE